MTKETTLERVEKDIERGDLGKARDRLHGLVSAYPDDLALRRRLGEVYARLQHPAMAGRYWYLEETRTPEMDVAVAAFEREAGKDLRVILARVKFRGDAGGLPGYARDKIAVLEEGRRRRQELLPRTPARQRPEQPWRRPLVRATGDVGGTWRRMGVRRATASGPGVAFGCLAVLALFVLALVLGFTAIIRWAMGAFS